jgi:L-alanine-DL-glutamate epimerase-like enolase superfamily enzyme
MPKPLIHRSRDQMIDQMRVDAYTIPTDGLEADGTIEWNSTTIIVVRLQSGKIEGLGYCYAHPAAARVVVETLFPILENSDPLDIAKIWSAMVRSVRNAGRQGITASAISAVDIALWDLKAKKLGVPVVKLMGQVRDSIPVYGSGGFTNYSSEKLHHQLSTWREQGIRKFKIKVGTHIEEDAERVEAARASIGNEAELFVDANGAYTRRQAVEMAEKFSKANVTWFEEPVPSDDLEGLCWLRSLVPAQMQVAAGEYGYDPMYFKNMLAAQSTDVLQADATRCLGFTGFLNAAALCEAFMQPLSSHTAPSLHLHVTCAAARAVNLEYFSDHERIEKMFFDGWQDPVDGCLGPDLSRLGLGLHLREADVSRFLSKGGA